MADEQSTMMRNLLLITNIFFCLLGCTSLTLGTLLYVRSNTMLGIFGRVPLYALFSEPVDRSQELVPQEMTLLSASGILVISAGGMVIILGVIGFFAAWCRSPGTLILYAVMVAFFVINELVLFIMYLAFRSKAASRALNFLHNTIKYKYAGLKILIDGTLEEAVDPTSLAWDYTMAQFRCCGNESPTDFLNNSAVWDRTMYVNNVQYNAAVPPSCCVMRDRSFYPTQLARVEFVDAARCLYDASGNFTYTQACFPSMLRSFMAGMIFVIMNDCMAVLLMVLTIIYSCYLAKSLAKSTSRIRPKKITRRPVATGVTITKAEADDEEAKSDQSVSPSVSELTVSISKSSDEIELSSTVPEFIERKATEILIPSEQKKKQKKIRKFIDPRPQWITYWHSSNSRPFTDRDKKA